MACWSTKEIFNGGRRNLTVSNREENISTVINNAHIVWFSTVESELTAKNYT